MTARCDTGCRGTGTYGWGAFVNGAPAHSGPHYHCGGRGYVTDADLRRNWGYWQNVRISELA